jgi:hypothetical protein
VLLEDRVRHHRDDEGGGKPQEEGRVGDIVTTSAERVRERERERERERKREREKEREREREGERWEVLNGGCIGRVEKSKKRMRAVGCEMWRKEKGRIG